MVVVQDTKLNQWKLAEILQDQQGQFYKSIPNKSKSLNKLANFIIHQLLTKALEVTLCSLQIDKKVHNTDKSE